MIIEECKHNKNKVQRNYACNILLGPGYNKISLLVSNMKFVFAKSVILVSLKKITHQQYSDIKLD